MACIPHARGGVSTPLPRCGAVRGYSPRSWGCFSLAPPASGPRRVFPTLVGVFHGSGQGHEEDRSIPHARGGVSQQRFGAGQHRGYSPRSWGCFRCRRRWPSWRRVFPTLVGVFPGGSCCPARSAGIPHARGGVSEVRPEAPHPDRYSPRSWGCFLPIRCAGAPARVFPTLVGVFPVYSSLAPCYGGIPHARGGVSTRFLRGLTRSRYSPRSWGCFYLACCSRRRRDVFPTLVGVFLRRDSPVPNERSIPHARGGVS